MATSLEPPPADPALERYVGQAAAALTDKLEARLLRERSGLDVAALIQAELGWDSEKRCYVLPVRDVTTDAVVGYREGQRGKKGRVFWKHPPGSTARLYAPGGLRPGRVLLCEGEWDTLMAWQHGINAVGTTGGAGTVPPVELLAPLRERQVFIAFDCDDAGRAGAEKWARRLAGMGCAVHIVDLDLPDTGADVSDWFVSGRSADDLRELLDLTPAWAGEAEELAPRSDGIQSMNWAEFWSTDPTPVGYLVEPLIAEGEVTRIFAQAKVGKSLLVLECAAGLATGRGALGYAAVERVPVIYVDQENTPDDWKTRLADMGYGPDDDWSDFYWFSFQSWPPLDTAAGGGALLRVVQDRGARLVVLDTQSKFLEGEEDKAFTGAAFYRHTLLPLKRLGVAVVVFDHAGNDAAKPRGSSSKRDDVDTAWRAERVGADGLRLTRALSRKRHEVDQLALVRRLDPLRHEPQGVGGIASAEKVAECIEAIRTLDPIPTARTSGREVIKRLREAGHKVRDKDAQAAWREMKDQLGSGE